MQKNKQTNFSLIAAVIHVSESEIIKEYPDYDSSWEEDFPFKFKEILWGFGLDSLKDYVRYDSIQHRNRLGEVVVCSRWYGHERSDKQWIESGYASIEALDKAKNSRLLDDSYRRRHMTEDAQATLESRDMFDKRNYDEDE